MKAQLRAVNPNYDHPRDRARREVKRFKLDREKGFKSLQVANQHEEVVKPLLRVDEVLLKSFKQIG